MGNFVSVGNKFPEFKKKAVVSLEAGKEFAEIGNEYIKGKWAVVFWWPKDFTFVCPTEIAEFNNAFSDFADRNTILLGASTDSEYVHLAWRKNHPDLKGLHFPMIADTSKSL
ncbi:MAG: redoxin domain-containing protein, partial [Bacteroidetes bacterium]|nr:redoxin domain-containing protein [Bacteroidota bacterium]